MFAVHTCLRGALLNGCPNKGIPFPLVTYSCYRWALVTLLWLVMFRHLQRLGERAQGWRLVWEGGIKNNTPKLPFVPLKQESGWRKIWVAFWQVAQTNQYIDTFWKEISVMWVVWVPHEKPHFLLWCQRERCQTWIVSCINPACDPWFI